MRPFILLSATAIVALVLTVAHPDTMIEPGPLSDGHRSLEHDCLRCHSPLQGASAGSCLDCHKLNEIGRTTTAGVPLPVTGARKILFHAGLAETNCMACHALHASERHRTMVVFQHDLLAPEARNECQSCHLQQRPADDLHRRAQGSCAECHETSGWRPAHFEHTKYFRFDHNHPAECRTCHVDSTSFSVYSCYGCHEHDPARIAAEHREEGIQSFENCVRCHRSGNEEEAEGRSEGGDGGEGGEHGEEED